MNTEKSGVNTTKGSETERSSEIEKILETAKKLNALAERAGTPEEAAVAAAKLAALLEKYDLQQADLQQAERPTMQIYRHKAFSPLKTLRTEFGFLLNVIATHGRCFAVGVGHERMEIWISGRSTSIELTLTLHDFVGQQMLAAAKAFSSNVRKRKHFCRGYVLGVKDALQQQADSRAQQAQALVTTDLDQARSAMESEVGRIRAPHPMRMGREALRGYEAGRQVRTAEAVGGA